MSGLTPPGPSLPENPLEQQPGAQTPFEAPTTSPGWTLPSSAPGAAPEERAAAVRDGLTTLWLVVAWFGIAAVIGAVLWWKVTPLAEWHDGAMDEQQLTKQFNADGWFFVIGTAGGLLSGLALVWLRRRNPVLVVVLLALGGAFATLVMVNLGLLLGPSDPAKAFAAGHGSGTLPAQLKLTAHGIWFVWSIAALVGGILALWVAEARESSRRQYAAAYGQPAPGQPVQNRA